MSISESFQFGYDIMVAQMFLVCTKRILFRGDHQVYRSEVYMGQNIQEWTM